MDRKNAPSINEYVRSQLCRVMRGCYLTVALSVLVCPTMCVKTFVAISVRISLCLLGILNNWLITTFSLQSQKWNFTPRTVVSAWPAPVVTFFLSKTVTFFLYAVFPGTFRPIIRRNRRLGFTYENISQCCAVLAHCPISTVGTHGVYGCGKPEV